MGLKSWSYTTFCLAPDATRVQGNEETMGSKYEPQPPTQSGKSSKEAERGLDDGVESIETVDARMRRMADGHAAQMHREAEKARQDDLIPFKPDASRNDRRRRPLGKLLQKGQLPSILIRAGI
jgi:hypothetical protein